MPLQFSKHYTVAEARALLPDVRLWLDRLDKCADRLKTLDKRVGALLEQGRDAGGRPVNDLIKSLAECRDLLLEFHRRQIQVKDLKRGLVDFPSFRDGREIFLCWERDEDDIEFWHDLETGYSGRERL
ncbi:MAG TPA: DUF2203 domain-containing protein [Candidatus Acidoferrum sp.]|nr:DUF2203 domain-containing protein [Candidatus Acidoferrum sp.]